MKHVLLLLLGFLWSARLTAIKAAGVSGIPIHVTVSLSVLGIALFFTVVAIRRGSWPPTGRAAIVFYILSGLFGFTLPFILETAVAPHLTVFVFMIVIATMPVFTLVLSTALGIERPGIRGLAAIALGFVVALMIAWDTASGGMAQAGANWTWIALALGVPLLYAGNTLFVASRWPGRTEALHVAHAQALIVSAAAVCGAIVTQTIGDWDLVARNPAAVAAIAGFEGLALLVYLKLARDHGATFVALANYVAMDFAAMLGALVFGDRLSWLSFGAALLLAGALAVNRARPDRAGNEADVSQAPAAR
ncbi:DMT family transporter [Oricola sp.]|uniref:DMT family transporter n=1 Tax=Oricola sp. TaxID=1979950 RepID=UPI003BA98812